MIPTHLRLLAVVFLLLLQSCSSDPETPEERIRALIDAGETAVESRDLSEVTALISQHYFDKQGLDRAAVRRLIAGQFLMHPSIHLLVQTDEIRLVTPERAEVLIYVAMSGTRLDRAEDLLGLRADLYRFDLGLEKEDENWRIRGGRWRRATAGDFLE